MWLNSSRLSVNVETRPPGTSPAQTDVRKLADDVNMRPNIGLCSTKLERETALLPGRNEIIWLFMH
jgi:hypothetical protein